MQFPGEHRFQEDQEDQEDQDLALVGQVVQSHQVLFWSLAGLNVDRLEQYSRT